MRSTVPLTLTCWLVLGLAGTARADDTAALIACERGVEHCEAREAALRTALDKANAETADRDARLRAALRERDEAEAGARSKATWSWALGVSGTVLEAGAVAVLLAGGSTTIAAGLAAVGAASAGGGILVASW